MQKTLDQNEARVLLDQLQLQAKWMRPALKTLSGESIETPALSDGSDLFADIEALEKHVGELRSKIEAAGQNRGATVTSTATKTDATGTKAKTATEKLLEHRGIKSISELRPSRKLNPKNYSLPVKG